MSRPATPELDPANVQDWGRLFPETWHGYFGRPETPEPTVKAPATWDYAPGSRMHQVYGGHDHLAIGGDRRLPLQVDSGIWYEEFGTSDLKLDRDQQVDQWRPVHTTASKVNYHSSAYESVADKYGFDDNHDGTWRDHPWREQAEVMLHRASKTLDRVTPRVERVEGHMRTATVAAAFAAVTGGLVYNAFDEWRSSKARDIASGESRVAQRAESKATSEGESKVG